MKIWIVKRGSNIKTFYAGTQPELNKLIKAKQISKDIIKEELHSILEEMSSLDNYLNQLNR